MCIRDRVYIQCVKDGSHRAEGIVTGVSGSSYTVTTTAGEMYLQESAYIYRSPDYDADSCLGTGVVQRTAEVAVSGTGSILKMYVSDGDTVERGQLLFETVSGSLMGLSATGSPEVTSDSAGVVTQVQCSLGQQVQQGATLAVLAPRSGYQVAFTIPEDLLSQVAVGDTVEIYFNWNEDKSQQMCIRDRYWWSSAFSNPVCRVLWSIYATERLVRTRSTPMASNCR